MPDPSTTTPVPPQLTATAEKRRALEQTIAALAALFPATFAAEPWQPHKPLKLGIHLDLIARGVLLPAHHVVAFRGHRFVIHRHGRRFVAFNEPKKGPIEPSSRHRFLHSPCRLAAKR
jgi:ProQ/FINO family